MENSDSGQEICACAVLRRAERSVTQLYDLVLQPCGLKSTQFIALKMIHAAGELAQCRFAREQAVAVETLSRRFAVLRNRGLVKCRKSSNHGEQLYTLTDKGKEVLSAALPYWERAQERFAQTFGKSDLHQLIGMCESAVGAAHRAAQLRSKNNPPTRRAVMAA